ELHGGTIQAEFPEDGGSRFVVVLPLHGAPAPSGEATPTVVAADPTGHERQ
ncbi:MAG: hypothetical protein JOZ41_12215, partial [Chloroflexi bacterium]|nr:hypothetical protein [Chloroflexota bacterium]